MKKYFIACCTLWLMFGVLGSSSQAAPDISIVGADPGPNATGEIPAYTGNDGLTCHDDFKPGDYVANPYKDEKPLYRIDHTNVEQYKDRLSEGQYERVKRHKNFYMNIYPTHRGLEYPKEYYAATAESRKKAHLDENNILQDYQGGAPFPVPKNGTEAIWNIKRMYSGDDAIGPFTRRTVSPSGKITKEKWTIKVLNYGKRRLMDPQPNPENVAQKILTYYTYPADSAGTTFMSFMYLDDDRLEDTWLYIPALRRVRRAPTLSGGGQMGGEMTMDEQGFPFRGKVNDWNWKLLGKKEMFIPYNCYDMFKIGGTDEEETGPLDINPERIRYELHRVWVVEGTVKDGINHPYSKRVSYYDEDIWEAFVADRYDKRGNIWRMYESYSYPDFCIKFRTTIGYIYMNLESGRYDLFGGNLTEKDHNNIYNTGIKDSDYTVQKMRKMGR